MKMIYEIRGSFLTSAEGWNLELYRIGLLGPTKGHTGFDKYCAHFFAKSSISIDIDCPAFFVSFTQENNCCSIKDLA